MPILYAQTSGTLSSTYNYWQPIPGLWLNLPPASTTLKDALILLNVPNPYAHGNNFPGGGFAIEIAPATPAGLPTASFTYDTQQPQSFGRMPTTLVCKVSLTNQWQTVFAMWTGIRGSIVVIDSPASLTAIVM